MSQAGKKEPVEIRQNSSPLQLTYSIVDECMVAKCHGASDCETCIQTIYEPIFNRLEDSDCTGLVIDKHGIICSRKKKSLSLVVNTILRYKNRSPLRKLALVTSIEYSKDEEMLRDLLFGKGVNIRLFTDLEDAISWAGAYP